MIICYDDQLLCQTIQKPRSKREVLKVVAKRKGNSIDYHQSDLSAEKKGKPLLLSTNNGEKAVRPLLKSTGMFYVR